MKKVPLFLPMAVLVGLLGFQKLAAQTLPGATQTTNAAVMSDAEIAVSEANLEAWDQPEQRIGPNHRTTFRRTESGQRHIVEIGSGMNFWDGQQWSPSNPNFVALTNGGFMAGQVQDPVVLANDLSVNGAVSVRTPEGIVLNSTPVAVALYDAASGQFAVISTITNCAGMLAASNEVIYPDAFSGNICADMVYTLTGSTFSQDIVFTGSIDPADYGFPRNTTRIQIITEFYNAPDPDELDRPLYVQPDAQIRSQMVSPDLIDEQLGFGRFVLTTGRAYVAPAGNETNYLSALVAKEYKTINGLNYLFESVPYVWIAQALTNLPPCHPLTSSTKLKSVKGYAALPHLGNPAKARPLMVRASRTRPVHGVVIDYVANIGGTMSGTTIFKGDTTFLVSSAVTCNGPTTIEGGAVFKYKSGTSITLNNTLTCKTGMYRPAIFTGVDDNAEGDTMNGVANSGYTGTISLSGYANPALFTSTAMSFSGLRFRYAQIAVELSANYLSWTISHAQFVSCVTGVEIVGGTGSSGSGSGSGMYNTCNLNNCLFSCVAQPIVGLNNGGSFATTVNLCDNTIDRATNLTATPTHSNGSVSYNLQSTNSIFSNISSSQNSTTFFGGYNAFFNIGSTFSGHNGFGNPQYSLSSSPFQSVGAGNYYLAVASGLQACGTTNGLPATMLSDLSKRTTYSPWVMAGTTLITNLAVVPQAWRNTNVSSLGYHYDPIDTAFGNVYVNNASVTASGGAAIATFGTNNTGNGLGFGSGSSLNSVGTPNGPNWIVMFNTVQEGTNANWQRLTNSVTGELYGATPAPAIFTRFTSWSVLAQDAVQFYAPTNNGPIAFQDTEFHGGGLTSYRPTILLTNCLLERVNANLTTSDGNTPYLQNNEFFGGTFNFAPNVSTSFVKDNLFDQTAIPTNTSIYGTYNGGYNAFVTNNNRLLPTFASDIILTNSPNYQTGPLGLYYQMTNSVLINIGHTTANLMGLYHYTVMTNLVNSLEIKETNSVVDIGHHYVAVDINGNPIDTDGSGIPDYLADSNGNGVYDAGVDLANWLISPYNGLSPTFGLEVFTPLK